MVVYGCSMFLDEKQHQYVTDSLVFLLLKAFPYRLPKGQSSSLTAPDYLVLTASRRGRDKRDRRRSATIPPDEL